MPEDPKSFLARQKLPLTTPDNLFLGKTVPTGTVHLSGVLRAKSETSISMQIADAIVDIPIDAIQSIEERKSDPRVELEGGLYVTLEMPEMTTVGIRRSLAVRSLGDTMRTKPLMLALGTAAAQYSVPTEATKLREQGRRLKLGINPDESKAIQYIDSEWDTESETAAGNTTVDTVVHDPQGNEHTKNDSVKDTVTDTTTDTGRDAYITPD